MEDEEWTGKPVTRIDQINVDRVPGMIEEDTRIMIWHVANRLRISVGMIENFLHNSLSLSQKGAKLTIWNREGDSTYRKTQHTGRHNIQGDSTYRETKHTGHLKTLNNK